MFSASPKPFALQVDFGNLLSLQEVVRDGSRNVIARLVARSGLAITSGKTARALFVERDGVGCARRFVGDGVVTKCDETHQRFNGAGFGYRAG